MRREERTEVLIVGAGPVGMLAALVLSQRGVNVRIIDQEWRTTSRTYACALHPRTLNLLDRLGLAQEIVSAGRRVERVAFYEGEKRRAEAKLSLGGGKYPFVVVLAQSALEGLLEETLKKEAGAAVEWNHRLADLKLEEQGVVATVEKLIVSAKGFIVPEMQWSVDKTDLMRASYVIGADGPNSLVAACLKAGEERAGQPEFFAVFEFDSEWAVQDELRVILEKGTTSVLWPLPGNRFRWGFQLLEEHLREFPAKDRSSLLIGGPSREQADREFVLRMIGQRAPWFKGTVGELGWSVDVEFHHRLAMRFGQGRCWLAGDAAHQTGPAGMQSMNMGLLEAERLALALAKVIRDQGSPDLLAEYNDSSRQTWRTLLGYAHKVSGREKTDAWVRERSARILPCLPASGEELTLLLNQLGLDLV